MLRHPAAFYLVLSLVCVGAFGGGAWGVLTYAERNHGAQAVGSVQCTVLSNRLVNKTSLMVDARLQCPVVGQVQGTVVQLRIQHPPAKWPQTMALPVHRGRLGTVFMDGRAL